MMQTTVMIIIITIWVGVITGAYKVLKEEDVPKSAHSQLLLHFPGAAEMTLFQRRRLHPARSVVTHLLPIRNLMRRFGDPSYCLSVRLFYPAILLFNLPQPLQSEIQTAEHFLRFTVHRTTRFCCCSYGPGVLLK